jgi:hypothetical protein
MLFIRPDQDLVYVLQFINDWTKNLGIKDVEIDVSKIRSLIAGAQEDGHYAEGGVEHASVFRKLASFIAFFIAEKPIINAFPKENIGEDLSKLNNQQNAIMAFEIAKSSLPGSKIFGNEGEVTINKPIKLSPHSYVDIIDALSGVTPSSGMKMVAVLLEQMTYRQNSDCEYQKK